MFSVSNAKPIISRWPLLPTAPQRILKWGFTAT